MSQDRSNKTCPPGGGDIPILRNRYFTGKYMTARDFADEQHYMLSRQRLHNRLFHGWGIVCGLKVEPHPNSECQPGWLVIKAGVAMDCHGREIFLHKDTPVEIPLDMLPLPMIVEEDIGEEEAEEEVEADEGEDTSEEGYEDERQGQAALRMRGGQRSDRRRRGGGRRPHHGGGHGEHEHEHEHDEEPGIPEAEWPEDGLLVCVRYCEEEIEHVPALYAEGSCDPSHLEANRIREIAGIEFHRLNDFPGCWSLPSGALDTPCRDDCDEPVPGPGGMCLLPDCPCGSCVPLALLVPTADSSLEDPDYELDVRGRRQLITEHHLTHIVDINWTHGAYISLHELRHDMGGELRIRFNRKLQEAEGIATGINRRTFTVEFGGITRHMELLPYREQRQPYVDEDGCTAVFPIDPAYLRETEWGRENIADSFIFITLRCDFVLDCHDVPVDGNHLHGRLPSGDGRPGGEFVSWFRVVHSHEAEEE